jgi:outer membrane protein assembly factor BamB
MGKNKNKFDWIDDLNENNLKFLMNYEYKNHEIDEKVKLKVLNKIMESEKSYEKSKTFFHKEYFLGIAFASGVLASILILLLFYSPYSKSLFLNRQNQCIAQSVKGEAYIYSNKQKNKIKLKTGDNLEESKTIITGDDSAVDLKIAENSYITINENSKLRLALLYKDKNKENTRFILEEGELMANPGIITGDSSFEIETDAIMISVKGTSFMVYADPSKNTSVKVNEGKVYISIKFNPAFYSDIPDKKIKEILEEVLILSGGKSIKISYDKLRETENEIKKILDEIKNIDPSEMEIKIGKIKSLRDAVIKDENNEKKPEKRESYASKKIGSLNINLTEKETSVTGDGRAIYIASDMNKAVYAIDIKNGKLLWKFTHPDLNKVTCPAASLYDRVIIGSPKKIFVLDKNGKFAYAYDINKGPGYWSYLIKANNKLYIPSSETVYVYDGTNFGKLKNLPESMGQIYITCHGNNLILSYSNEQDLKIYDLLKADIVWTSVKLNNRSFMTPFMTGDDILIIDNSNIAYNFNISKNDFTALSLPTAAISNIIEKNSGLFFIGNNGNLYRINDKFTECKMIDKVDLNPKSDKYLTKKIIESGSNLYFCSDTGKLYRYDTTERKSDFIKINENIVNNPLISSPVIIGPVIYVIDSAGNIYSIEKNEIYED